MNILSIDQNMLLSLNHAFVGHGRPLDDIIKFLAAYLIYTLPIVLLVLWFAYPKKREALAMATLGAAFAWFVITKSIVPHIWFRTRPDLALIGAKELIFHRPDYSFPSDHATMLFGLAFGLYLFKWPKVATWFLVFAILICTMRVAIGVHFPLDIIAGAISGLVGVLIFKLFDEFLLKYLVRPIIFVLKKVRLA